METKTAIEALEMMLSHLIIVITGTLKDMSGSLEHIMAETGIAMIQVGED